jgi:hypothetical protein
MTDRQMHLGAFLRPTTIHTGAWRYPGAWADANFNLAHLTWAARRLEAARFDAVFLAATTSPSSTCRSRRSSAATPSPPSTR